MQQLQSCHFYSYSKLLKWLFNVDDSCSVSLPILSTIHGFNKFKTMKLGKKCWISINSRKTVCCKPQAAEFRTFGEMVCTEALKPLYFRKDVQVFIPSHKSYSSVQGGRIHQFHRTLLPLPSQIHYQGSLWDLLARKHAWFSVNISNGLVRDVTSGKKTNKNHHHHPPHSPYI